MGIKLIIKFVLYISIMFLFASGCEKSISKVKYCNCHYDVTEHRVFIENADIYATMLNVSKNGNLLFGYFKDALENDTNLIASKILKTKNGLIVKTTYDSSRDFDQDSTILVLNCSDTGLVLVSRIDFINRDSTIFYFNSELRK